MVVCVLVIGVADLLIWRSGAPYGVQALFDEPAHAAIGILALSAIGLSFGTPVVAAVLAGSLLIDLDHVPHLLGSNVLEHGVPRPYSHSLLTIAIVLLVALLLRDRRRRRLGLVVASALALHFFRDMAEPGGPGVSLLWPLSDHAFTLNYAWFAGLAAALAVVALARRRLARPRLRAIQQKALS